MLPWFHCHSQLNNSPSFKPTHWVKATKSMPGDIYLFHHDNSQPLSPSRHYQCYEGHPHILCTPVRPQTNQNKLSVTTNKVESVILFSFPLTHLPSQSFQQSLPFPTPQENEHHDSFSFQLHFFRFHTTGIYMHSSRGYHKTKRAHHEVVLAKQLLELLLQFCFLLRGFLQRVQGLLLKFSLQGSRDLLPWVHHPLQGGKTNKQKNTILRILHILTPDSWYITSTCITHVPYLHHGFTSKEIPAASGALPLPLEWPTPHSLSSWWLRTARCSCQKLDEQLYCHFHPFSTCRKWQARTCFAAFWHKGLREEQQGTATCVGTNKAENEQSGVTNKHHPAGLQPREEQWGSCLAKRAENAHEAWFCSQAGSRSSSESSPCCTCVPIHTKRMRKFLLEQNGHTGCSSARTKPQAATVTFSKELRTTNRQSKKLSIKQKQCHHLLSRKQLSSIGILLERERSKMHQDDFPQRFCLQHSTS